MKTIKSRGFFILVCLFEVMQTFAAPHPPHPKKTTDDPGPPPPGLPIDTGLYVLLILALLYGIYIIYIHNQKTKTPI